MAQKYGDDQIESAQSEHLANTITEAEQLEKEAPQRLDQHGLALIPQPSQFKDDPLVCPDC
jgi:hypothetical protein